MLPVQEKKFDNITKINIELKKQMFPSFLT